MEVLGKIIKKGNEMKEVIIDGKVYVEKIKGGEKYCIVRTYSAGVFAGMINPKFEGTEAVVKDARRIWFWDGAASLSQLAIDGTSKPENCKFPEAVSEIYLKRIIEIIPCTEKAEKSIKGVPVWKK